MFTIDDMQWDVPCKIERTAEIKASEISGMLLNKQYFNDVIGTYLTYEISIAVPRQKRSLYTRLYEILTDPVDAHTVMVPYNQGNITITGKIDEVKDSFIKLNKAVNYWYGISFTIISNAPNKTYSLGEAIARGLAPLPDIGGAQTGVYYIYDGTSWQEIDVPVGDVMNF